jgi:hypothetical protein
VFGLTPEGLREEEPHLVHAVEVTLVTEFEDRSPVGGSHKVDQFLGTLELFKDKYPTARIEFLFISDGEPSRPTREFVQNTVRGLGLQHRVRVIWRVVGW